jgi:CBS domain containing-hemolysin-like protein
MPWLVLLLASLCASAFCSGVETGAYSLNRLRLAIRAERGEPRARMLQAELQRPNRWLATLLIGNTAVGQLASIAIGRMLDGFGLSVIALMVLNALVLLPLLVIFGEALPKELFRVHADRWTVALAPVARVARWILSATGLVWLLEWVGEGLVRRLGLAPGEVVDGRQRVVDLLRESAGAVDERQVAMAGRVLELSRRRAADVMRPWKRVTSLAMDALPDVVREVLRARPHGTDPVVDESGACVGFASAVALLAAGETNLQHVTRAPVVITPDMSGMEVLRRLRESGSDLAVVQLDGRPLGIVGLRDLLEPVVGRLPGW